MKRFTRIALHFIFLCSIQWLAMPFLHASEQHQSDGHNHGDDDGEELHEHGEDDEDHDDHHGHHDQHSTEIGSHIAQQVAIITAVVGPHALQQSVSSYGQLTTGPEQLSHVRARFAGVITSVSASIGDSVEAGDLLAQVESNESLKKYSLRAPISGTIVQRHANAGEVTQEQILFSIARFDTLWAELRLFPNLHRQVSAGQKVFIPINDTILPASIEHIIPSLDQPYQLARVKVDNSQLGFSPGMLIEAKIVVADMNVPLAVQNQALQTMDGLAGVFVRDGERYEFKALELGRRDEHFTEVLSGLQGNEQYVTENSYLIKADIEKSAAEHVH